METFTLDPRCWRLARIFCRNPLVRRADRIEAFVVLVAMFASLVAIPVAAVVGASTYSARDRLYAREALERHRVAATVVDASAEDLEATAVEAKWPVSAGERTGTLPFAGPAKPGDRVDVWVDNDGNPVVRPTPAWLAVGDGIGMATVTLLSAVVVMATAVTAVRSRLDRARYARWDREIERLVQDGGRQNRQ